MRRGQRITIAAIVTVVLTVLSIGAVQFWLWKSPLVVLGGHTTGGKIFDRRTAVGRVFANVQACGERQNDLYGCIQVYKEKYGRLPEDMKALINGTHETKSFRNCPAGLERYEVHFESFGKETSKHASNHA